MNIYIFYTEKYLLYSLTSVYGLGKKLAIKICKILGFSNNFKTKDLSKDQLLQITLYIENSNLKLMNDLKKEKYLKINSLIEIKSYRGLRLLKGLPVRGQRTRTNANSCKKFKKLIFINIYEFNNIFNIKPQKTAF